MRLPQTIFFPGQKVPTWLFKSSMRDQRYQDVHLVFADIVMVEVNGKGEFNLIKLGRGESFLRTSRGIDSPILIKGQGKGCVFVNWG